MNRSFTYQLTRGVRLQLSAVLITALLIMANSAYAFDGDYSFVSGSKPEGVYFVSAGSSDQFGQWTATSSAGTVSGSPSGNASGVINSVSSPNSINFSAFRSIDGSDEGFSSLVLSHTALEDVTINFDLSFSGFASNFGSGSSFGAGQSFQVRINGEVPPEFQVFSPDFGTYEDLTFLLSEGDELSLILSVSLWASGFAEASTDVTISNFSAIPEPSSSWLLGMIILGWVLLRLRNSRQS